MQELPHLSHLGVRARQASLLIPSISSSSFFMIKDRDSLNDVKCICSAAGRGCFCDV